jgi:hypothetical protein
MWLRREEKKFSPTRGKKYPRLPNGIYLGTEGIYLGSFHFPRGNTAIYRRPGQRGLPTRAVIDASLPDPRSALETVVGPTAEFRITSRARFGTTATIGHGSRSAAGEYAR